MELIEKTVRSKPMNELEAKEMLEKTNKSFFIYRKPSKDKDYKLNLLIKDIDKNRYKNVGIKESVSLLGVDAYKGMSVLEAIYFLERNKDKKYLIFNCIECNNESCVLIDRGFNSYKLIRHELL